MRDPHNTLISTATVEEIYLFFMALLLDGRGLASASPADEAKEKKLLKEGK